jgi:hypothetical protein
LRECTRVMVEAESADSCDADVASSRSLLILYKKEGYCRKVGCYSNIGTST